MKYDQPDFQTFKSLAQSGRGNLIPVARRLMSDQLTPVMAYRRLVRPDDRMAASFLLESVVDGDRVGRYSYLGAQPIAHVIARGHEVEYRDIIEPANNWKAHRDDPLREMAKLTEPWRFVNVEGMPDFTGGWVGCAGYDVVRYLEGDSLPSPPPDDRHLPDMHMQLYREVVAFDHVQKTIVVMTHAFIGDDAAGATSDATSDATSNATSDAALESAYADAQARLDVLVERIETPPSIKPGHPELPPGVIDLKAPPPTLPPSNMGEGGYQDAVRKAKQYIAAGDIFQVVPSQRFEMKTQADPFEIYRALRIVNPSPYMCYLQIEGAVLVASSPEILCRVQDGEVTNRPLAGTRRRGHTAQEDKALEAELLADAKEIAEHVMLVDLGRNDVGRVAKPGTIELPALMTVERYSHVMHISSTVTGKLLPGKTCWDALQVTLPVGTVSGAPKIRAMQIIDEFEPTKRGPYAGALGCADFAGNLDMAIALRTLVAMPGDAGQWIVHLQAGGGIVAESDPDAEHQETVNKAAALAKAVDLAERAFHPQSRA